MQNDMLLRLQLLPVDIAGIQSRRKNMKPCVIRGRVLAFTLLLFLVATGTGHAGRAIETAGDVLVLALPAIAGGVTLAHRDTDGLLQLVESGALALGTTYALKYAVSEERPNHEDDHSFPSAHSSVSFVSAEYLRKRYGWEYGLPAYAVAAFVAYSRVESDHHYAHDVIAGAAIGIGSAYFFTRPYAGWNIQPVADSGQYGVRVSRNW